MQGRNITNQKDLYYESPLGVQEGKQRYLRQMEECCDSAWRTGETEGRRRYPPA